MASIAERRGEDYLRGKTNAAPGPIISGLLNELRDHKYEADEWKYVAKSRWTDLISEQDKWFRMREALEEVQEIERQFRAGPQDSHTADRAFTKIKNILEQANLELNQG